MAIGVKVVDRPIAETSYVRATLSGLAQHAAQPRRPAQSHDAVSRREGSDLAPLARDAPHADHGGRQGEVRGLRTLSRRCARRTASSSCRARTSRATAIRSCSRSTSSAAFSAATARRFVRRKRSTSGGTTRTRNISREGFVYDLERLMAQTHPVTEMWDPADPEGRVMSNFFYKSHFYLFGMLAIASAIVFVTRKSPVAAALWLVNTMFCLAALYVMLDAHFIGVIQVLVYAGAIMVVFLFVVMLLNLGHPVGAVGCSWEGAEDCSSRFGARTARAHWRDVARCRVETPFDATTRAMDAQMQNLGAVGAVAEPLFREYLLAFELTSLVLLVAMIGAVVLGKRQDDMIAEALALSAALFMIGAIGVLTRRNAIIIFMCVELMLNAVNLSFVAFSRLHGVLGTGVRRLRDDGRCRGSGGRACDHHRHLPPCAVGQSAEHQPAERVMLLAALQAAQEVAARTHALAGSVAEWIWLVPALSVDRIPHQRRARPDERQQARARRSARVP